MKHDGFVLHNTRPAFYFRRNTDIICYINAGLFRGEALVESGFFTAKVVDVNAILYSVQFYKKLYKSSKKTNSKLTFRSTSGFIMSFNEFQIIKSDLNLRNQWLLNMPLRESDGSSNKELYVEFSQALERAHKQDLEKRVRKLESA